MPQESVDQRPILLQSRDHSELLNIIDQLRSQGVSHYVPLPQLIVCGDQSSGKSSVLEAVSGIRFPTKDSLCTCFATELILRREPTTNVAVSIVPGRNRSDQEKASLSSWKVTEAAINKFPSLIEAAKNAMGLDDGLKTYSDDVFRVEVTGPTQPQLTLVDLPGLFHASDKQQSTDDAELVESLVRLYMAKSRSIILAVVSASNEYVNQKVTKLAREFDHKGHRTLGIITKPDTLYAGSEREKYYVDLATNDNVAFRLGWHVLRNRDYHSRDCSTEERDEQEKSFFSKGIWTGLPMNLLGVGYLKPRLSKVLRDQIISELPSLIRDVENGIDDCHKRLARLGESRRNLHDQRRYLLRVGQSFGSIVKAAVGGMYVEDFFGSANSKEGYQKRLRAVVQALLLDFAKDMRVNGHDREIVKEISHKDSDDECGDKKIERAEYILEVRNLMRRSMGCELPGTFNPLIIGDLFFQQSKPWRDIVSNCCCKISEAVARCTQLILANVTDDKTRAGLHREIVDPALQRFSEALSQKVAELIKPHQKGHPITYNSYFTDTVERARQEHRRKELEARLRNFFELSPGAESAYLKQSFKFTELLNALENEIDKDPELSACSEATDCMEAYYQVAMKVFVDNIAVLAIEFCLLEKLTDILSPEVVMNLDDAVLQEIAAEGEDSKIERERAVTKLQSLEKGLLILRRLRSYGPGVVHDFDSEFEDGVEDAEDHTRQNGFPMYERRVRPEADDLPARSRTPDFEFSNPISPAVEATPFDEDGTYRGDDSWLNSRGQKMKKKVNRSSRVEMFE